MDSIGDGGDGHIIRLFFGPEEIPHAPADPAVQLGDGVATTGIAQGKNGHAEGFPQPCLLRARSMNGPAPVPIAASTRTCSCQSTREEIHHCRLRRAYGW